MSKKNFIDRIEVKSPCSESWDMMAGNEIVRFCSHCSKNVNNLSGMTRRQAEKLIRKSVGTLCVTYKMQPESGLPIFAQKVNRLAARSGFAAGVLGASLFLVDGMHAQTTTVQPDVVQTDRVPVTGDKIGRLSGYVTDPNGAAIPFALVSLTNKDTSDYRTASSTADGLYEFTDLPSGNYVVKFEGGGFEAKEVPGVYVSEAASIRRDAQLDLPQLAEIVQVDGTGTEAFATGSAIVVTTEARNALVMAVLNEDLEEVKARVMMRAKVNTKDKAFDGITPLHAAVETGNVEIVRFLLGRGAKINIRDYQKRTPLMMMDENTSPELFQLLISYGAKLNLVDKDGNTALHLFAAYDNQSDMLRTLVSYGVNVNAVNKEGKTALMIAAENDSLGGIEALIRSGADLNKVGRDGKTA